MYIVALEVFNKTPTQYLATWSGDPGRTCVLENAKRYNTISSATFALAHAKKYHDYINAEIIQIDKE